MSTRSALWVRPREGKEECPGTPSPARTLRELRREFPLACCAVIPSHISELKKTQIWEASPLLTCLTSSHSTPKHPHVSRTCICPLLTIPLCGEAVPQQDNIKVIVVQTKGRRLRIFPTPLLYLKATGTQTGMPRGEEEVGRWCLSAEMPLEEHKNAADSSG